MILTFTPERETKGTWRFSEVLPGDFAEPKIGTLYVRKAALGEMGYEKGDNLIVNVSIDGNPAVLEPKPRPTRSRRK